MTEAARKLPVLVLAALIMATAGSAAVADQGGPDVEGSHSHPHGASLPESKIEAFAAVATEIQAIGEVYLPKIKAAKQTGNEEKARTQAGRARDEMTKAIQEQDGISVKEYRAIARRAREDAALAGKIRQKMTGDGESDAGRSDE